jgi:CubicO group peptidase (beta-lactamase class C family)
MAYWKFQNNAQVAAALLLALAFNAPVMAQNPDELQQLETNLGATADGSVHVPGVVASIKRDGQKQPWSMARGGRTIGQADAQPDDEFRIASVTKSFVAAAILRLVEDGKLKLNQPIAQLLSTATKRQLDEAGYGSQKITVQRVRLAGFLHDTKLCGSGGNKSNAFMDTPRTSCACSCYAIAWGTRGGAAV